MMMWPYHHHHPHHQPPPYPTPMSKALPVLCPTGSYSWGWTVRPWVSLWGILLKPVRFQLLGQIQAQSPGLKVLGTAGLTRPLLPGSSNPRNHKVTARGCRE